MNYKKIESKFIKEELKKTDWKNHKYIDDLMWIEDYALRKTSDLGAFQIEKLKSKYSKQWKMIWQEINPKGYARLNEIEKKQKQKNEEEDKIIQKEFEQMIKQHINWWKQMGGKVSK